MFELCIKMTGLGIVSKYYTQAIIKFNLTLLKYYFRILPRQNEYIGLRNSASELSGTVLPVKRVVIFNSF